MSVSSGLETKIFVLVLGRIRFAESESGFESDSVKPSIQCANPNPDSSESSFDADSLAKPEVNDVTPTSPT